MTELNGNDNTEIVKRALEQEQVEKDAKKRKKAGVVPERGKSLVEIEEEEGGVVKESMVGMAHTKRAMNRRKGKAVGDTELVTNIEDAEEEGGEGEQAVGLEPFNLKKERETGYFDEEGNYVEEKDPDEFKDAWLDSSEAQLVSVEVRRRIEEEQRREEEADKARPPSGREIADLKGKIAVLLHPRETVNAGLKRLGAKRAKPQAKKRNKPAEKHVPTAEEVEAKHHIETITEAASLLLLIGETDIYSETKEDLASAVALYAPLRVAAPSEGAGKVADMFADDDDEDMFAADDKDAATNNAAEPSSGAGPSAMDTSAPHDTNQPPAIAVSAEGAPSSTATQPPTTATQPPTTATQPPAAEDDVDYSTWPIAELKRFLTERGQDPSSIVEKTDLISRVKELAAQGPEGAVVIPEGYVFDANSGYYYSSTTDMYYDATSGGFYSSSNDKWYVFDATSHQFTEWATGQA